MPEDSFWELAVKLLPLACQNVHKFIQIQRSYGELNVLIPFIFLALYRLPQVANSVTRPTTLVKL